MIEILNESTEKCLAVRFSGKVTGQEYQKFLEALGEKFQASDQVSLVLELSGFEFYGDFESAKKDFKFGFGNYKRIHRAAFVGDQKWIEWFTRLIGPFTHADEKHFPEGQVEAA
ncbi:MAG TPA: STAS/SEC14 domain-containing protein, partial [Anaerolineales bacterium]|nr:STAS/SEC14 domain-containing protein [Anaerolineales bacterium]